MRAIELSKGQVAIVDDDSFDRLAQFNWSYDGNYAVRRLRRSGLTPKKIYMHRLIMGDACEGLEVDHINGNKLDNRKENLRIATRAQNARNIGLLPGNKSGFKGVHFNKLRNKWTSQISFNGKAKHLGLFLTAEEASAAYKEAAKLMHGEFAFLGKN